MEDQVFIQANQLSKKFSKSLRRSMFYGSQELFNNLLGLKPKTNRLRPREFWAVDHIDLTVKRGQVLGIIGPNGCGKTTLLRLIAGIYPPDDGSVLVRGKLAALIALGVGFHPYLTGFENIYLNGALLGMSKQEIDKKMDEIINFAELKDFINVPVATYSSGMRVRLGFSIAIAVEPDVLLLDEILAVGDRTFKAKSYSMIEQLSDRTASILITHNMQMVARVCTDIIVMDSGRFVFQSKNVSEGVEFYQQSKIVLNDRVTGKAPIELVEFQVSADGRQFGEWAQMYSSQNLHLKFEVVTPNLDPQIVARILIYDSDFNIVGESFSDKAKFSGISSGSNPGKVLASVNIPSISLHAGTYSLSLGFIDLANNQEIKRFPSVGSFQVLDDSIAKDSFIPRASYNFRSDWKI